VPMRGRIEVVVVEVLLNLVAAKSNTRQKKYDGATVLQISCFRIRLVWDLEVLHNQYNNLPLVLQQ
jgi:hypothetical protein